MSLRKNKASLTGTEKARLTGAVRQVKRYVTRWEAFCLPVFIGLLTALPGAAKAETCTMYEKYVKESGAGTPCTITGNFKEVTASGGTGSYYARRVPKCDSDGTNTSCSSNFVKSLDGTRAFYHIDPNPNSTGWVFFFDGGGACGEMAGNNAAEACFEDHEAEVGFKGYDTNTGDAYEMTTKHASGGYTVRNRKEGTGILSTDAANPYAAWNRVWFNKSSFDRFMGNKNNTQPLPDGDNIELYFHGRLIIQSVIKELNRPGGVSFSVGGEVVPDLSLATNVLFIGESGGAGGIIHNAQWIKNRIEEVSTSITLSFAAASRMLPWIEAEAYFGTTGDDIWDDRFSGTSTVEQNPAVNGSDATITYSADTFKAGGDIRELLDSWGDINSTAELFLDGDCKNEHYDDAHNQWKCYDKGHVALYHMDENVFFFESLFDGVHEGDGSPVLWMDTKNGVTLDPGFVWDPTGTEDYSQARINRVLHTIDAILLNTNHRGKRAFYVPAVNAHTMVKQSSFYTQALQKNGAAYTFASFLQLWQLWFFNPVEDLAVIDDDGAPLDYQITWSSIYANFGGGWNP